jgi:TRAP-type C4-dicarboxylate transport system permease small subunit
MSDPAAAPRTGAARAIERIATLWALGGGVLILATVAVNTWSIVAQAVAGRPFAGAFELTEVGVATAVFTFLPYCQLTGANVTADIFTARARPRTIAAFGLTSAVVALGFALLIARQMTLGLIDQRAFGYTTTILQLPIWWAFAVIVASLALLAAASLVTLIEAGRAVVRA